MSRLSLRSVLLPVVAAGALGLVGIACDDASTPPPRSPLGEDAAGPVSGDADGETGGGNDSGEAAPVLSPLGPGAADDGIAGGSDAGSGDAALEARAAAALTFVAEVLGVPERTLSLAALEPVVWNNGCLGVSRPGILCVEALTPGWRAVVPDGLGSPHTVHGDDWGQMLWAGERSIEATLVAVDPRAGTVSLEGPDGAIEVLAIAPGTAWYGGESPTVVPPPGAGVLVLADASPVEGGLPVVAWLAVIE